MILESIQTMHNYTYILHTIFYRFLQLIYHNIIFTVRSSKNPQIIAHLQTNFRTGIPIIFEEYKELKN